MGETILEFLDPLIIAGFAMIIAAVARTFFPGSIDGFKSIVLTLLILGTFLCGASGVSANLLGIGSFSFTRNVRDSSAAIVKSLSQQEVILGRMSDKIDLLEKRIIRLETRPDQQVAGNAIPTTPPSSPQAPPAKGPSDPVHQAIQAGAVANANAVRAVTKLLKPF